MNKRFVPAILAVVAWTLGAVAIPLGQLGRKPGLPFYANGLDETSYLQYGYAKLIASMAGLARGSQWIVVRLHEAGWSGGWINLAADLSLVPLTIFAMWFALSSVGAGGKDRRNRQDEDGWLRLSPEISLLLLIGVPLIVGASNPLVDDLARSSITGGGAYWFTYPHAVNHVFFRTPEPQVSYLLLSLGAVLAVRFAEPLIVFAVLPFLYPFVAIPAGFVACGLVLVRWLGLAGVRAAAGAALIVAVGYTIYIGAMVPKEILDYFVETRLPLVSWTGLIAVGAAVALRAPLRGSKGALNLLLILSPWIATNLQLVGGRLLQPNNYEQYWGVFVPGLLYILNAPRNRAVNIASGLAAAFALVAVTGAESFREQAIAESITLTSTIESELLRHPELVAVDDVAAASWFNLVHPRQDSTLFSITRTYKRFAEETFEEYLCARQYIRSVQTASAKWSAVFATMDAGYRNTNKDNPFNHIYRREFPTALRDVDAVPSTCPNREYELIETSHPSPPTVRRESGKGLTGVLERLEQKRPAGKPR